jgi:hypothetical protein
MRDIVTVAHALFVRMCRAHSVAAVVIKAAGENGSRPFEVNGVGPWAGC